MRDPEKLWADLQEAAHYIQTKIPEKPEVGLILGSALGPLAEQIPHPVRLAYQDVPHMLVSTAPGHAGEFVFGRLADKPVVVMSGRFHYYEGYDFEDLAQPVRLLKLLGVKTLILTNAAGCVRTDWQANDIMLISDHIKLMGASPLRGANLPQLGVRFPDSSTIYTPQLRTLALETAAELGQSETTHEGVYFFMPGPQYETPAEIRAIQLLGGDAVGMSTVTEAITAAQCGLPVLGLSLLTNMAAGLSSTALSEEEVTLSGQASGARMAALLQAILAKL
ncbi:MAG: purine-nucleoside phosphorylase [Eubacteriales bacterium]|nr:purine-nucleoside phosphorylase [Clostridiales bacterium]MDY5836009.1 purine-nucleoside phosphorylase [Eubacteriales bacterium]